MRKILHVVDMSPCIYAGSFNTHSFIQGDIVNTGDGYRERNIPTGGTSMLFNILAQYMGTGPIVFVADRNPTIKKEIHPEYKGKRTHPPHVQIGKEVAEYILQDCGFTVYAEDGYEADDLIYTIVSQNLPEYDHIFVHTADSDLYFLVGDKVSILPTSSKAKLVTMENYTYTCRAHKYTPYNCIVFEKFLAGDRDKCIAPLPADERRWLVSNLCKPEYIHRLGSVSFMTSWVTRNCPENVDRLRMFYPLWVDRDFEITQQGNRQRILEWAYEIRNRKLKGVRGDLSVQVKELMDRALYLE